jgi:ferritin-like metal-binding protein YciE
MLISPRRSFLRQRAYFSGSCRRLTHLNPALALISKRRQPEPKCRLVTWYGSVDRGLSLRSRRQSPLNPEITTMGLFTKDIKTMNDLFVHQLKDIYYAEKRIVGALPTMIEKTTSPELRQAFETHLSETKNHVKRVEEVFRMHGVEAEAVTCPAIDGIIKEADEVAGEVADKKVLDAALIAAAQAVEHYEMARYGTLIAWAKQLGRDDCASVLKENLAEESAADKKLTDIAETRVNRIAA